MFRYALSLQLKMLINLLELVNCHVNVEEYEGSPTILLRYSQGKLLETITTYLPFQKWFVSAQNGEETECTPHSPIEKEAYQTKARTPAAPPTMHQEILEPTCFFQGKYQSYTQLWVSMIDQVENIQTKRHFKRPTTIRVNGLMQDQSND